MGHLTNGTMLKTCIYKIATDCFYVDLSTTLLECQMLVFQCFLPSAIMKYQTKHSLKKGLLAFKTTLKISPVSTFHWKKKQRVCNINKLLYIKQYTRQHHREGIFFSTGRNGQDSQTELVLGQSGVKVSESLLDGDPVLIKRWISFIQIQISVPYCLRDKKKVRKKFSTKSYLENKTMKNSHQHNI